MTWAAVWKFITEFPRIVSAVRAAWAALQSFITDLKVKRAKKSVDETVQTGDQRAEEAAIGSASGIPYVDPVGSINGSSGLQERPVIDRTKQ